MSVQAITAALAVRGVTASQKLLLIVLANYANEELLTWYSQKRIAADTSMSDRGVRKVLKELEDLAFITRDHRRRADGSRTSDAITINAETLAAQAAPDAAGLAAPRSGGLRHHVPGGPAPGAGLSSFEPPLNQEAPTEPTVSKGGARLPDDWTPTAADRAFAEKEGLTREETDRAALEFGDYWRAIAGHRGRKLDWSATWRNRIRELGDRRSHSGSRMAAGPANRAGGGRSAFSFADEYVRRHGAGAD